MCTKNESKLDFFVGQKGHFMLLDSFKEPIEAVNGEIVQLMEGKESTLIYAMILTQNGTRPARLA